MGSIKRLSLTLVFSLVSIFAFANSAHAEGIYSKADAAQMFEMSVSDWNANVMAVQTQGIGQALGNPTDGFGMAIETPEGYLIVRPNYRTPAKPEFLSVTIGSTSTGAVFN